MKKIFLATAAALISASAANAADLAPRMYTKAPAPVAAVYDWSGFYVGGHVGGGWADQGHTIVDDGNRGFGLGGFGLYPTGTALNKSHPNGVLGGVQGGFNWQVNNFVLGVEGEYTWAGLRGESRTADPVFPTVGIRSVDRIDDIATVTGRLGYAFNNWLFYGKGGWAWARGASDGVITVTNVPFGGLSSRSEKDGWVAGAGIEWGFAPNWSAKIEYEHIDLGNKTVQVNTTGLGLGTVFADSSTRIDTVKAGVNYRFNWGGSAVARY
ncbi:outer membrane protein [Nitrobacter sp. JJSN]|uniref:outer membrane protein n=1 Tax=Nitrobacter sp. JJSN TaxID=3453033 RepID=UPI003F76CA5B